MEDHQIRVLCADDHPIVREGIRAILNACPDIAVVADAGNGEEALALFRKHQPDVTLMDLRMPGMSGIEIIQRIRSESPQARIIVLTTYQGEEDIYRAIQAGAATYVLKETMADRIAMLVRNVYNGGRPIPEEVAARLAERITHSTLTQREIEVLEKIAAGLRNKQIAWALGITEETVQVHVKNILAKLEVHDRTEAVTVAVRRGILHLS